VYVAAAYNMLGAMDAAEAFTDQAADANGASLATHAADARNATMAMKCVLEQNGLGCGGVVLGGQVLRSSNESQDLMYGLVLAIDTFALALRSAGRMIADSVFSKTLQQRYASYQSGFGERLEKGAASLEECEEFVRKGGEPHPVSGQFELLQNAVNHYVFPPRM